MIEEVSFNSFYDSFRGQYKNNFSYEGLRVLYDYLEEYEEEIGQKISFDVVAIACDYTEYEDINEYLNNYSNTHDDFLKEKEDEFKSLLNDDEDFKKQYKADEFKAWLLENCEDEVLNEISEQTTLIKIPETNSFIIQAY